MDFQKVDINQLGDAIDFLRRRPSTYLATIENDFPWVRPMLAAWVDDSGTVWYPTRVSSEKVQQIKNNPNVCVATYDEGIYLRIFGKALISEDVVMKKQLWDESWKVYFSGEDDPEYALIRVSPEKLEMFKEGNRHPISTDQRAINY